MLLHEWSYRGREGQLLRVNSSTGTPCQNLGEAALRPGMWSIVTAETTLATRGESTNNPTTTHARQE
jgi:hypothetical protein